MPKDLFSSQSIVYSRYRPSYPEELIDFILNYCEARSTAWDCATGNGQLAIKLAPHFEKVFATDISEQQLSNAVIASNIDYSKHPAETTTFPGNYFDLVTVAQAYHWFNFALFEKEVKRVAKPGAVIAIAGYNLMYTSDKNIDTLINHFYEEVVGPYWDNERRYLEKDYATIPFPFSNVIDNHFKTTLSWERETLAGYLRSWSGVQHFIGAEGYDPVGAFIHSLDNYWREGELKQINFPLFLKLGRIDH